MSVVLQCYIILYTYLKRRIDAENRTLNRDFIILG